MRLRFKLILKFLEPQQIVSENQAAEGDDQDDIDNPLVVLGDRTLIGRLDLSSLVIIDGFSEGLILKVVYACANDSYDGCKCVNKFE